MQRKHSGYILLWVLVIAQLLLIITMKLLGNATDVIINNSMSLKRNLLESLLTHQLYAIGKHLNAKKDSCKVNIIPTNLKSMPLAWWQQHACSNMLNGLRYYYIVQFIGWDECGIVVNKNEYNQLLIAHYYQITLYSAPPIRPYSAIVLQMSWVEGDKKASHCASKFTVTQGFQTLRHL